MTDDIEQKLDQLTVMMGKLVAEDEGQGKQFKPWVYQSKRGRGQNRGSFRWDNAYQGHWRYNQDFRDRMEYSSNNRGSYGYNMRGNQWQGEIIKITIIEEVIIGIEVMIGIGVDHVKGRVEIGDIIEV